MQSRKRQYKHKICLSFGAENFDTSLIKIDREIRKLYEFKYLKTNFMEAAILGFVTSQSHN